MKPKRPVTVERLKRRLLADLDLMTPEYLDAFWEQVLWLKPDFRQLAKGKSPLAFALTTLQSPAKLAQASAQPDPWGWLLRRVDLGKWCDRCQTYELPWMSRVWLATASQLRAQHRLAEKAHGLSRTWSALQCSSPAHRLRHADSYFLAQLQHAKDAAKRDEILAAPGLAERLAKARAERDEAFLRRFRRAKQAAGKRAGASLAEKYLVQNWTEQPEGLPGLCFFHDSAIHVLLDVFDLSTGQKEATKDARVRLGLTQAGAKRQLVEKVDVLSSELRLVGSLMTEPIVIARCKILWGGRVLWPRSTAKRL